MTGVPILIDTTTSKTMRLPAFFASFLFLVVALLSATAEDDEDASGPTLASKTQTWAELNSGTNNGNGGDSSHTARKKARFFADIITPSLFADRLEDRRLQGAECVFNNGTSITCWLDNEPEPGLVQVFNCPGDAGTTADCSDCAIYSVPTFEEISDESITCNICAICPARVFYDCSNLSITADECSTIDCAGDCLNQDNRTIECTPDDEEEGSQICLADDPAFLEGFVVQYSSCPDFGSLTDCSGGCEVIQSDSIEGVTDASPRCSSCSICDDDSVAFDCAALLEPDEICSIQDCDGTCLNLPPSSSPSAAPTQSPNESPSQSPSTASSAVTPNPNPPTPPSVSPTLPPTSGASVRRCALVVAALAVFLVHVGAAI